MADTRYIALLRGINVGGKNIIRMADLKACFESMAFTNVITYIQSGNVLFNSPNKDKGAVTQLIEQNLSEQFGYESRIVLLSKAELKKMISAAPPGFGAEPDLYRYDVLFLRDSLTATQALKGIKTRDGVDQVHAAKGVLFFSRLMSKATQSYLNKIVGQPIYKEMTIRNWNTTTKLLELA